MTDNQLACVMRETAKWVMNPQSPKHRGDFAVSGSLRRHGLVVDGNSDKAVAWCALGYISHVTDLSASEVCDRLCEKGIDPRDIASPFDNRHDAACAKVLNDSALKLEVSCG